MRVEIPGVSGLRTVVDARAADCWKVADGFRLMDADGRARVTLTLEDIEDLDAVRAKFNCRITHGRHCTCGACAREDWTRITAACGMHGNDCPAVYAPLGLAGDLLRCDVRPEDCCGVPMRCDLISPASVPGEPPEETTR